MNCSVEPLDPERCAPLPYRLIRPDEHTFIFFVRIAPPAVCEACLTLNDSKSFFLPAAVLQCWCFHLRSSSLRLVEFLKYHFVIETTHYLPRAVCPTSQEC